MTAVAPTTPITFGEIASLVAAGLRTLRRGGWRLAALYVVSQVIVAALCSPVVRWLFGEALAAAGVHGLDADHLTALLTTPLSLGWLLVLVALVFVVMALQLFIMILAVRRVRLGLPLQPRALVRELADTAARLWQPGSLVFIPFLFILVPLAGFAFVSVLSKAIAIPQFITGELMKTLPGVIAYVLFLLVLSWLIGRLALTPVIFATSDVTGGRAMGLSWKATRRNDLPLVLSFWIVMATVVAAGAAIVLACIVPTILTDALWPEASPVVAAIGLVVAQLAAILLMGAAVVVLAGILVAALEHRSHLLPADLTRLSTGESVRTPKRRGVVAALTPIVVLAVTAVGLSVQTVPVLDELADQPHTLVLAHRGFTEGGVENTIASLDAARAVEADVVEMDVMQTRDGGFIVMHDATLGRLAGVDVAVKDLTLAEATALEVSDGDGHRGMIPAMTEYVRHAAEIGQPLLIELKLHGGESDDVVARLVDDLEAIEALETNIYHSLSASAVEELKRLRPSLTVGLTTALAGTEVPQTSADIIVVEDWSYNPDLLADVRSHGLSLMTWTTNDVTTMREHLRDDVDGIITDHADVAVRERAEMLEDEGLAGRLYDAIFRFVTIF